ncbi:MAG: HD domain-containing protein [Parcubacteria group bacterium]|nr:HD domain-containing protein [Parcubacteria group bacterium]
MEKIFLKIWGLAKPYYEKGRPMDVDHIDWMMEEALFVCKKENIDDLLLLPLVILHDIGYAKVSKDNPFNLDLRSSHMKEGEKIAREILEKLNYPKDKIEKIVYYVSIHDNWAFGETEIYRKNQILRIFKELDFIWMATPKGFLFLMKILNKSRKQMINYLEEEKPAGLPFSTETTRELYYHYLNNRKKEVKPNLL